MEGAAWREQSIDALDEASHEVEAVDAAIEREPRLELRDLRLQLREVPRGDIGQVGHHGGESTGRRLDALEQIGAHELELEADALMDLLEDHFSLLSATLRYCAERMYWEMTELPEQMLGLPFCDPIDVGEDGEKLMSYGAANLAHRGGHESWTPSAPGTPREPNSWQVMWPVADRVNSDKFYIYHIIEGRVYVSTNGGASWSPTATPGPDGTLLRAVPGREGHLWLPLQWNGFFRSIDSGANPYLSYAVLLAAQADMQTGDEQKGTARTAAAAYKTFLDTYPNDEQKTSAQAGMGRMLAMVGDTAAAAGLYQEMTGDPSKYTDSQLLEAGTIAFNSQRYADAAKLFDAVLQRNPYYRDALFNLANTYWSLNQWEKMQPVARRLRRRRKTRNSPSW